MKPADMDEGTIKTPIPKCRLYWCLSLGWRNNFVGSESGQKQSVELWIPWAPAQFDRGLWAAAQERRCLCVHKRGNESPLSKYRGLGVYSMKKTGGRMKMFIIRANAASWLSSCLAPSQSLLKSFLMSEITLWPWILQNMVYNTTQTPPPPHPHSHTLSVYTFTLGRG